MTRVYSLRGAMCAGVLTLGLSSSGATGNGFVFRHHFADAELPGDSWGQTALIDVDRDGDLDFITGRSRGEIRWYEYRAPEDWKMHRLGDGSASDVGGVALDVNADGRVDFVTGGVWFEQPADPAAGSWPRWVFDAENQQAHDVAAADIDGDTRPDILTMSDRNDLRWYRIGNDPRGRWERFAIGPAIHAGLAAGDIDGDGDIDVARGAVWFENHDKGRAWVEHVLAGMPWADRDPFRGATRSAIADLDGDGRPEIILTEAEFAGGRVAWFKAPGNPRAGPWNAHVLPQIGNEPQGPYHSLQIADFDGDGDPDIFAGEMEHLGTPPHRWIIWENPGGPAANFEPRLILDAGLGTHEAVAGDVDGDGDVDLVGKLWRPEPKNANKGRNHIDFLQNERLRALKGARVAPTTPVMFDTPEADGILAALQVFPPDNPWNQAVDAWPLHPDSAKIIASIGAEKPLRYNADMAFVIVPPDQPRVEVAIVSYAGESDRGPYPIPDAIPIEGWPIWYTRERGGEPVTLADVQRDRLKIGGDRHAIVVDPGNRTLYEFFEFKRTDRGWQAAQASIFDLSTNTLRPDGWTSADAAGLPIFPAIVRHDDLARGIVAHAMRVTVTKTRRAYTPPATHFASRHENPEYPRMGERIRLTRDYPIEGFSPQVQAILKGLKRYGMFVADNGIDWAISVAPDARIPSLHEELRRVTGAAFEVVVPPPRAERPK